MPDRIGLRRLIQQSAYLSDSHAGRRITGNFCALFQLPNGKRRIWNCCRNRRQFTTMKAVPIRPGRSYAVRINTSGEVRYVLAENGAHAIAIVLEAMA